MMGRIPHTAASCRTGSHHVRWVALALALRSPGAALLVGVYTPARCRLRWHLRIATLATAEPADLEHEFVILVALPTPGPFHAMIVVVLACYWLLRGS